MLEPTDAGMPHGYRPYPHPLATQADVLQSQILFETTLQQFQDFMNIRSRNFSVGGVHFNNELQHQLYIEVSARGGGDIVTARRSWVGVAEELGIPANVVQRGHKLRKQYTLLMIHYENVYMHRARGFIPMHPGTYNSTTIIPAPPQYLGEADMVQADQL